MGSGYASLALSLKLGPTPSFRAELRSPAANPGPGSEWFMHPTQAHALMQVRPDSERRGNEYSRWDGNNEK
jgi:hypothetical protein